MKNEKDDKKIEHLFTVHINAAFNAILFIQDASIDIGIHILTSTQSP